MSQNMKSVFYVIVFIYMCYRAVYGAKIKTLSSLSVDPLDYNEFGNYFPPGTVKMIPCVYNSKIQQVEWIDPSGNSISHLKTSRIYSQKNQAHGRNPSLLLTITDAWVEDSGMYECRSDGQSKKISLCVIDPLTFVDTPSDVSVDEGRSYTLTCEARGRPEPRLVWYRNEEVISDDCNSTKYKVMTKFNSQGFQGQLTISSLEPSDAGSYSCEAIQEHGELEDCSISKTWNISLNVNHAPIFDGPNETVLYAKVNSSVDLVCEPKAYPVPKFRWFSEVDDGTLVNYPPEKIISSEDNTKSTVTIVANAVSFGMKYVCRATNSVGYASKTFTILELKKPKQPYEVETSNSTDTQIEFHVSWEDEIQFPVDEVEVQYLKKEGKQKRPRESDWKKDEQLAEFQAGDDEDSASFTVTVSNLQPETDYWIRLRAVNQLGYSPWSIPVAASTIAAPATVDTPEQAEEDVIQEKITEKDAKSPTDPMYYGIFFTGGILVISFLFMVIVKLI